MQSFELSFWFYLIRLVVGGAAAFCAILYLSKTRELAWVFIITGTLQGLRIVSFDFMVLGLRFAEVFSIVMSNLPLVFIILGFISIIIKHR